MKIWNRYQNLSTGKIPDDWRVTRLGEICTFKRGFSYSSDQITERPTNIRFITINDFKKEGGLKQDNEKIYLRDNVKIDPVFFLNEGDVLIANTDMSKGFIIGAPILIKGIEEDRLVYSMDLTKLIFDDSKISGEFLFYLLKMKRTRRKMKSFAQGTNVLHLNLELVKNLLIPFPPLPEQRAIAKILSTVDEAIQKVDEAIAKTERLKKGLMQKLLIKGIGHKEFRYSKELGCEIPKEWKVVRLEEIAAKEKYAFVDGPFGSNLKRIHYSDQGILVIQSNYFINGKFELKPPIFYVSEEKASQLNRSMVRPADIVIAKIGVNFGRSAIVPSEIERAILSGNTMKLTVEKSLADKKYIVFILNYFKEVGILKRAVSAKTAQPALTLSGMRKFKIPLPPLPEQHKIAEILSTVDKKLELERKRKEKLERIKKDLMNDLLTGKKRVKIGTGT